MFDKITSTLIPVNFSLVRSGSFVYDVEIPSLSNWKPTSDELRIFSAEMVKFSSQNLPVERLSIQENLACEIFKHNKFKLEQIPSIAEQSPGINFSIMEIYLISIK